MTPPAHPSGDQHPRVAVIGGSGFYEFLENPTAVAVPTPYGDPSAPIAVGEVGGRPVAFLPRHGPGSRVPAAPDQLPGQHVGAAQPRRRAGARARARSAGCSRRPSRAPSSYPTSSSTVRRPRVQTYVDTRAAHAPFADPYCPDLRSHSSAPPGRTCWAAGTMVVIEGPRFSTRAESQSYARAGWTVVNMTGHPEAVLARELGVCYATIALVTDLDAGVSARGVGRPGPGVRALREAHRPAQGAPPRGGHRASRRAVRLRMRCLAGGRDAALRAAGAAPVAIPLSSSGSPRPRHAHRCVGVGRRRSTTTSLLRLALHAPGPRLPSTNLRS